VPPEVVARVTGRLGAARPRRVLPRPPVVVPVAAFDLVRGGRRAPQEAVGKRDRHESPSGAVARFAAPVGKAADAAHPKPPYTHERMSVLEEILAAKRAELALLQESEARTTLRRASLDAPPARDFAGALRRPDNLLAVVAEIKRRSPSKGDLAPGLDPGVVAKAYETG